MWELRAFNINLIIFIPLAVVVLTETINLWKRLPMIEINLTLELFQVKSLRLLGYQRLIEYSWNNILQVSGDMVGKMYGFMQ